jgi:hypothetical protein
MGNVGSADLSDPAGEIIIGCDARDQTVFHLQKGSGRKSVGLAARRWQVAICDFVNAIHDEFSRKTGAVFIAHEDNIRQGFLITRVHMGEEFGKLILAAALSAFIHIMPEIVCDERQHALPVAGVERVVIGADKCECGVFLGHDDFPCGRVAAFFPETEGDRNEENLFRPVENSAYWHENQGDEFVKAVAVLITVFAVAACGSPGPETNADDMTSPVGEVSSVCRIESNGAVYAGPCTVLSDDESTGIVLPETTPEFEQIVSIGLFEFEPGQWEVRGLTTDGLNSRWGTATRVSGEETCWQGSDFRICVSQTET